jgi:hypothetical protein
LWQGGQVNTLDCQRVERTYINCTIETAWLGWLAMGETPVYGLQEAAVWADCDDDDDGGCVYRIDLTTEQGDVSLSPPAASGRDTPKRETVRRINLFIDDPSVPTFRETHSEIGFQMLPVFIFMTVGLGIMGFGLLAFVNELRGRTVSVKRGKAVLADEANTAAGRYAGMTGCQLTFTLVALLLTAGLGLGAFGLAATRLEETCLIQSRGWSENAFSVTSQVEVSLVSNPARFATFYQTHPDREAAETALESYQHGDLIPCGVNPWFTQEVTFTAGVRPAGHIFLGMLGLALLVGGFTLGNVLSIIRTPAPPLPLHLPVRLQPEGGIPTTQLWFLLPMLLGLLGAIYAFFWVAWLRFSYGDGFFWAGLILLLLSLAAAAGMAYLTYQQVYLLYSGSQTIVELSAKTLRAGQAAQVYLAHRPGRLTVEALRMVLKCEETTRERVRHGSGSNTSYNYDSHLLHEQTLYETRDVLQSNPLGWAQTLDFDLPAAARPSTAIGRYPEIRWWLELQITVPGAPDYKLEYPLRMKR